MQAEHPSDEDLVAEWRRAAPERRERLVDELFGRHYERVARWCLRWSPNRESAADLAQEVFLRAHKHLDSFRGQSRFTSWLYAIARNEALTRMRRAPPPMHDPELLETMAAIDPGPDVRLDQSRRAKRIIALLSHTLDATEQAVFTLHYGEDVPLDTITRLLRLQNPSGAKAYIVSAKRKLARAADRLRARGESL
jgi:RNA polymerase sigma-70 factor (ECF subfamily)